jgi:hypothetical protein
MDTKSGRRDSGCRPSVVSVAILHHYVSFAGGTTPFALKKASLSVMMMRLTRAEQQ